MTRKVILCLLCTWAVNAAAVTLQQCQDAAQANYPLIKQRELIERTTHYTLSNIRKGWLPQVSVTAQATLQSDVVAWPQQMRAMMDQMGLELKGLKKDQYRIGVDINQNVWDGGSIAAQTAVAQEQGQVSLAQNEVNLHAVRRRVNEMYFALLLVDQQLALNDSHRQLLDASEKKLAALLSKEVVAQCDYDIVRAEQLAVTQQRTQLEAQRQAVALMLGQLCGITVDEVEMPLVPAAAGTTGNHRPELRLADAQLRLADAQERSLNAALMPRVSLFAQGYYGYPGYNMFEDMVSRKFTLNGMIGARLTWNMGALYTRRADKAKLQLQRDMARNSRDLFLLNNSLEVTEQQQNIARYNALAQTDQQIIDLRERVRKAAESKLAHGIIDVNDLVKEINRENEARVNQWVHQIEMLKQLYDLKITVNN